MISSQELETRQREMRERTERKEDVDEVQELAARIDVVCPYCQKNLTVSSPQSGVIHPCATCRQLKIRIRKYDLGLTEYFKMLREQDDKCAVCGQTFEKNTKRVDVDRDLGHVRGLVCAGCNTGLSHFQDSQSILENAIKYLKFNRIQRRWWAAKYN